MARDPQNPVAERSRQDIVTLLLPTGYGAQVAIGVLRYAREHRNWQVRRALGLGGDVLHHLKGLMQTVKPAGIIGQLANGKNIAFAKAVQVPVVNVSGTIQSDLPLVGMDNAAIGRLAAQHLIDRGYRQLACLSSIYTRYSELRAEGFMEVAKAFGVPCVHHNREKLGLSLEQGQLKLEKSLGDWLTNLPSPVGLFSGVGWGDVMFGPVAKLIGKRVPEDLAIVVVGDDPAACEMDDPPLTSVDYPGTQIGYEAARLLARLIAGEKPPSAPLLLPPTGITERASTSMFSVTDPDVAAALKYIEDWACKGKGVHDVCNALAISRSTLHRRFLQQLGRTVHDEIMRVRLAHAKYLLRETDLTPATVARRTGMEDASRLCHTFRKHVGMSPGKYRRNHRPCD